MNELVLVFECLDRRFAALEKALSEEQRKNFFIYLEEYRSALLVGKNEEQKLIVEKILCDRPLMSH